MDEGKLLEHLKAENTYLREQVETLLQLVESMTNACPHRNAQITEDNNKQKKKCG